MKFTEVPVSVMFLAVLTKLMFSVCNILNNSAMGIIFESMQVVVYSLIFLYAHFSCHSNSNNEKKRCVDVHGCVSVLGRDTI